MRIVQLSDIHLSSENITNLENYYLNALIKDLQGFHSGKNIDVIILTGDLVDRGGKSLGNEPYSVFQEKIIEPLAKQLNIPYDKFLFIPGNHDVDTGCINERDEYYLNGNLTKESANQTITKSDNDCVRLNKFKVFEKRFHSQNNNYHFTQFNSSAIINFGEKRVGFALINDSWRCSPKLKKENHFIGHNQLYLSKKHFDTENVNLKIAIFHHPLELLNDDERDAIDNILKSTDFQIAFFGHTHRHRIDAISSANGSILVINGRAAFNNPNEKESLYQSGYNVIDIDFQDLKYTLHARKFIENGNRFDYDTDSLHGGYKTDFLPKKSYFPLSNNNDNNTEQTLPKSYQADVTKVVKLLIGKSLYPDPYIFVRELVQNSVDACNRIRGRNTYANPKIQILINTQQNSFEIIDEGDGMSKRILREHFSIVGKSISQEFTDAVNHVNLISQFGIGFISVFIVAEQVTITTKSEEDGIVKFIIKDVFKDFIYDNITNSSLIPTSTGTSVKVKLKQGFLASTAYNKLVSICRHINNLEVYYDEHRQYIGESWNLEQGLYVWEDKNDRYECRLAIGNSQKNIIATNNGFLISQYPTTIYPTLFPYIIGGEIVFQPKVIDLDLSRSNIMATSKADEIKNAISFSLRFLFRQVIENNHFSLLTLVSNYLQYYLINYESIESEMLKSYKDFYSKNELIQLCTQSIKFEYMSRILSFYEILISLKIKQKNIIYYYEPDKVTDIGQIMIKYLSSKEDLVISNSTNSVHFLGNPIFNYSIVSAVRIIAQSFGFILIDVQSISNTEINKLVIERNFIPEKIVTEIAKIESDKNITVNITQFGSNFKQMIQLGSIYYINYNFSSFQSLCQAVTDLECVQIYTYLSGILGIPLNSD